MERPLLSRALWTIVLRESTSRFGVESTPHIEQILSENRAMRIRKVSGFLTWDKQLTERVVALFRSQELGWVTVAAFIDGQQVVRAINHFTPVLYCQRHPEGHWRCLDPNCRNWRKPFPRIPKVIDEYRAREERQGGSV